MTCVAVFGASGFVGATLVERLMYDPSIKLRPFIHSSGNAARLARHGLPMYSVDVLQPEELARALDGVTHVVNCTRGPAEVMLRGLENVLRQCKTSGVHRVVHLSSVAVYGDVRPPREIDEGCPARPAPGTYGALKLRQDEIVARYTDRGLPAVVLCPPNISGPHSPFLLEILQALRRGDFALVDQGQLPCELVDIENLVHAIRLALDAQQADGRRIFVTDAHPLSWRTLTERLLPLADAGTSVPSIPGENARRLLLTMPRPAASLGRAVRHLFSAEVRAALRKDPWFAATESRAKAALRRLAPSFARRLAERTAATSKLPVAPSEPRADVRLLAQQLRGVRYSIGRATHLLGYEPVVDFDDSMRAFQRWYHTVVGWNAESWSLARELYR